MKINKLVLLAIILILWGGIFVFVFKPGESEECRYNRFNTSKTFRGIIIEKIRNSPSHSNEQFFLKPYGHFEWEDSYWGADSFYHKVNIGDSVVKKLDSLIIEVYRNGKLHPINIELNCQE